jgi:NADH-quinone oxidoreductase subunit F
MAPVIEDRRSTRPGDGRREVLVCGGGACVSCQSRTVSDALSTALTDAGLETEVRVVDVGCMGLCGDGPLVLVSPDGVYYRNVADGDAERIVREHLVGGDVCKDLEITWENGDGTILRSRDVPFFARQHKIVLRNSGVIDPTSIDEYAAAQGYEALANVLQSGKPEETLSTIEKSGLRGRGGAGFPTGAKWRFVRNAPGDTRYVVCNADEGDPGAFMDRSVLESDPHSVLEGMTIAGYVVGSQQGYIYVRAEYPLAIERLGKAIHDARQHGLLGCGVLGSDFDFDIEIRIGAGAFVCGEETSLMHSIEGKRGTPRPRPPFPAQKGLFDKPTLLNNVESWANVPAILLNGADWYSTIGTDKSKGTKVFALAGSVTSTGLVEVPMGTTLREVVEGVGGGVNSDLPLKAAQSGGPSGGCVPTAFADVPIDYESLQKLGAIMGSGGLVVLDDSTCMVELARFFLEFLVDESCGKCPPCRIGNRVMLNILTCITQGKGTMEDLDTLEELGQHIQQTSLCGLGQTAPNAVLSTLRHFRHEYVEHIEDRHCRASACRDLMIAPCSHACPAGVNIPRYMREAASGRYDQAYLTVREKLPLPHVCGMVCFAPCEMRCRRAQLDETLSIRAVKRAACAYGAAAEPTEWPKPDPTGRRVAVVGSGPAGLTAAYYLSRVCGHEVTVFEALAEPGGMLRYGIPRYRLPAEDLDREISGIIESAGVEIRCNAEIDSVDQLTEDQGFDAVFLGVGAHAAIHLGIPGEDVPGVFDGVALLRDVASGAKPDVGKRVAVVGGGNTAIDAARTARRLGAEEIVILYRRTRAEMPADQHEIQDALDEGIVLRELCLPVGVKPEGGDLVVETVEMQLGDADESGRRSPQRIEGSEGSLELDSLISAIGQRPHNVERFGIELGWGDRASVKKSSLETSVEGVFAGGDFVLGPASVIEAIAQGRKAAEAIDLYLGGNGNIHETLLPPENLEVLQPILDGGDELLRERPRLRVVNDRVSDFVQIETAYSRQQAEAEATRCLRCDLEKRR